MDENVAAPAPTGEAAPSTTNTTGPSSSIDVKGENMAQPIFTPEEAKQIKDFFDNNGGFEKVKKNLTMRQADLQPQPQAQTQAQPPTTTPDAQLDPNAATPQPQQPAQKPIQGGITAEEFMIQQYFQNLAQQETYVSIKEQMTNGEVLKQMAKFNIQPMINGQFNDRQVRDFLDMYAKTVPAEPAQAPVTTTPTVEYVQVGETITTMQEAMAVLAQDQQLRGMGQAGHPMAKQANEFFDNHMNGYQNRGKREHKPLDVPAQSWYNNSVHQVLWIKYPNGYFIFGHVK